MAFSIHLFEYIAPIIGIVSLLIGIAAAAKPEAMSAKFGIAAKGATWPYVVSTGMRDVFMGLTVLILFYLQQWQAQGAIQLCLGVVALSDFWVVSKYGDRRTSFVHLFSAVFVIVYGSWLLAR
jgi:hypothetical protein